MFGQAAHALTVALMHKDFGWNLASLSHVFFISALLLSHSLTADLNPHSVASLSSRAESPGLHMLAGRPPTRDCQSDNNNNCRHAPAEPGAHTRHRRRRELHLSAPRTETYGVALLYNCLLIEYTYSLILRAGASPGRTSTQ